MQARDLVGSELDALLARITDRRLRKNFYDHVARQLRGQRLSNAVLVAIPLGG